MTRTISNAGAIPAAFLPTTGNKLADCSELCDVIEAVIAADHRYKSGIEVLEVGLVAIARSDKGIQGSTTPKTWPLKSKGRGV